MHAEHIHWYFLQRLVLRSQIWRRRSRQRPWSMQRRRHSCDTSTERTPLHMLVWFDFFATASVERGVGACACACVSETAHVSSEHFCTFWHMPLVVTSFLCDCNQRFTPHRLNTKWYSLFEPTYIHRRTYHRMHKKKVRAECPHELKSVSRGIVRGLKEKTSPHPCTCHPHSRCCCRCRYIARSFGFLESP